jgi:hypothetical protein
MVIVGLVAVTATPVQAQKSHAGCNVFRPAWHPNFKSSTQTILHAVAGDKPNDVWAVGSENPQGAVQSGPADFFVARWSGSKWRGYVLNFGALVGDLNAVTVVSHKDAWAVGYASRSGGKKEVPLSLHWNGHRWHRVSVERPRNRPFVTLIAVAATSATNVWAVGYAQRPKGGLDPLVEHLKGSHWQIVKVPKSVRPKSSRALAQGISMDSSTALTIVGTFLTKSYVFRPFIWTFSSGAWKHVGPRPSHGTLDSVASYDGASWSVGGQFGNGGNAALIVADQGGHWSLTRGDEFNSVLNSVSAYQSTSWAIGSGSKTTQSTRSTTMAERLKGSGWHVVHVKKLPKSDASSEGLGILAEKNTVWATGDIRDRNNLTHAVVYRLHVCA